MQSTFICRVFSFGAIGGETKIAKIRDREKQSRIQLQNKQ